MLVAYRSKNRAVGYEYTERDQQQKTGHFETCNQELSPSYTSNAFPSDLDTTYPCASSKRLASISCCSVATGGDGANCNPNPPSQATTSLRVFTPQFSAFPSDTTSSEATKLAQVLRSGTSSVRRFSNSRKMRSALEDSPDRAVRRTFVFVILILNTCPAT